MPSGRFLSPRELAEAYGVSESSMKRWIDSGELAASRTAGGHRRVALTEAVRFSRRRGLPLLKPEAVGLARPPREPVAVTGPGLTELLASDAADTTPAVLAAAYVNGASLAALCDGPVREALSSLGERWCDPDGPHGIMLEHRAVALVGRAVAQIRALMPDPEPGAPVAVGGSADVYRLPTAMAAAVLADAGWRAIDLGAQTPLPALAVAARLHHAELVWLSNSVAVDDLRTGLGSLAALAAHVVIGGREGAHVQAEGVTALPSMQALHDFAARRAPTA